jgi:hypothetical protein
MFCAPAFIFCCTEGVGSRFHVLRAQTRFQLYQGRRVPFSFFIAPGLVFMFCSPELIFSGTEGVRCCFHVLRARTHFRRYRGRWLPFSCFARPDSFLAVPRESDSVLMFYATGLVFGGTEGVRFCFHVLRVCTSFLRYRGRRVPFSCFARPHSFSTVPRASGPFYCLALPHLFSAVPRASGPVFMFCARTHFRLQRGSRVPCSFPCAPGIVFGRTVGIGSRFHVLLSRTHFRRNRGCRFPFSCFARSDSFSAVPRVSGPVYMFCSPGLVFGGNEGVGSRFQDLRTHSRFL